MYVDGGGLLVAVFEYIRTLYDYIRFRKYANSLVLVMNIFSLLVGRSSSDCSGESTELDHEVGTD